MNDLDIIKELERELGIEIQKADKLSFYKTNYLCDKDTITGLSVYRKGLKNFPILILQLDDLEELYLDNNQLTTLPESISRLNNLKALFLNNNQLTSLPESIIQLKKLKVMDINNNRLATLPKYISQLNSLRGLYFDNNQLTTLPESISDLNDLREVYLNSNMLTTLPESISQLNNLKGLYLNNNQLTSLPESITKLKNLQELELDGNPLKSPPIEIAEKGIDAIREYFKSLETEETLPLNEVKVLLVGDGGAGKTSLVKRITGLEFDPEEEQTYGININKWPVLINDTEIKLHLWDFGGQVIMHSTHQFFLSKRSFYVLVLDGRKEENPEYWLKLIESYGGDSPIIIVMNKVDQNPSYDVNREFLQGKYKGLKGFLKLSCQTGEGIKQFVEGLYKEIARMDSISTTWGKSWFDIKTTLENMDDNYINLEHFNDICIEQNLTDKKNQDTLVGFLHDLGVALHFKELKLLGTHILNPRWATQAVYRIITYSKLAKCNGVLDIGKFDEILEKSKPEDYEYPADKYEYIINLMRKFELCYRIGENQILIPDLLGIQELKFTFDYVNALNFILDFDYLPKSILPRFIVKMNKDIKDNFQWRTGVVLEDINYKSTAVIKADIESDRIYIYVDGLHRRDYFTIILFTFREIIRTFKKLNYKEQIPMPDNPEIKVSYKHLVYLEERGIDVYIPDGAEKEYDVKALLGTIKPERISNEELYALFQKIKTRFDSDEDFTDTVFDVIKLQPSIFGVGVDIGKLVKKVIKPT